MAILPANLSRVSNTLRTSTVTSAITRTQQQMLQVQNELTTGKRLTSPSSDPGDAAIAQQLRKTLEHRAMYANNLKAASSQLSEVDSTLDDLTGLVQQAKDIASANVGSDVTPDARKSAAAVVDSLYNQALSLANKQLDGVYLFGGDRSTQAPFVSSAGGVQFVGSDRLLQNRVDEHFLSTFMVDGGAVFGAESTQVQGTADLTPTITASTRLADIHGTNGNGVQQTGLLLANGTVRVPVDLSTADTIGDVIDLINAAAVGGITASLGSDGHSLVITPGPTETLAVEDHNGGTIASDLGILQVVPLGAGVPKAGSNVIAKVSPLTRLTALNDGAGIDTSSGFLISNGGLSATVDLSGAVTVEDLLNRINASKTGVRAEINATANGINLINATQGTDLRVSEIGGTTASDLGIRSFTPSSSLASLNGGKGVRTVTGNDFTITRSNGTQFGVDISSAVTIQDVIDAINTADGGAGLTASFATTGNGIVLTDTAGGPGQPALSPANFSNAAADLGLLNAPTGAQIVASDVSPVRSEGLFANLAKLRNALNANDPSQITAAAEGLETDHERIIVTRGTTGAKIQEIESRESRVEDQNLATKSLLSELEETNYTDAIARYQTLQTMLQASLQTGAAQLNLSLLDFIG